MKPLNINADQEFLFYGKGYVNGHYNNWWDKGNRNKLIPLKKSIYKSFIRISSRRNLDVYIRLC